MTIHVSCPGCSAPCLLAESMIGKRVRCPRCGEVFVARSPAGAAPAGDTPAAPTPPDAVQSRPAPAPRPALSRDDGNPPASPAAPRWPRGRCLALLGRAGALLVFFTLVGVAGYFLLPDPGASRPPRVVAEVAGEPPAPALDAPQPPEGLNQLPPPPEPPPPPDQPEPEPPAVATLALTEKDRSIVELPGPIGDVVIGGERPYLFLHLPGPRQIAVFDVAAGKVVRFLPVEDERALIAAGATRLFVALPDSGVLQRWDLSTLRRDATVPLPFPGPVKSLSMGPASEGPLLVRWAVNTSGYDPVRYSFLDAQTLKPTEVKSARLSAGHITYRNTVHVRASDDGRLFGMWGADPQVGALVLTGGEWQWNYAPPSAERVVPGPDGRTVYTAGGPLGPECRPLPGQNPNWATPRFLLPARQGNYFLRLQPGAQEGPVALYRAGESRPLLSVTGVEVTVGTERWISHDLTDDKRVHFFPASRLLVTIPAGKDRLVLHRLDPEAALKRAEVNSLVVTTEPPPNARKGATWSYQPVARSRQGAVAVRLEAGPEGMKLADGRLTWPVPADHPDGDSESVILYAADPTGQQVYQTFRVRVRGGDPAPRGEPPPEEKEAPGEPPPEPAAPKPGLKPPALDKPRVELALPAPVADLAAAGGGRYLVLHLPSEKKFAVFDANEGKVVHYLPAPGGNVKFTAGADKLLVVIDNRTVERWSLTTYKKEDSAELPFKGVVHSLVMGSASNGPLVFGGPELRGPSDMPLRFLDVATLRETTFTAVEGRTSMVGKHPQDPHVMRASADGRVLGMWNMHGVPSGLQMVLLDGTKLRAYYDHESVGTVVPGPDGKTVYTGMGLHTAEGDILGGGRQTRYCVPAYHGDYYLATRILDPQAPPDRDRKEPFALYLLGDSRPVCPLPDTELSRELRWARDGITVDKRFHLLPDAHLFVVLPPGNDRLVLHRFDPEEALAKSGLDYLLVTSRPPASVKCGQTFAYQLGLKCKAKGVRYRVESGPPGLEVARGGRVTWAVPADFKGGEQAVVLGIRSDSGRECYHAFKITVTP